MSLRNTSTHYGAVARMLHWLPAALVIGGLVLVEIHEFFPKGSDPRAAAMAGHFQSGLLVFALVWPRLLWSLFDRPPAITPEPPTLQMVIAKAIHGILYLLLIALPILGVVMMQANGKPIALLGLPLPILTGEDKAFADQIKEVHELLGNTMIVLIVVHVLGALWHHVRQGDDTLLRMLPQRRR